MPRLACVWLVLLAVTMTVLSLGCSKSPACSGGAAGQPQDDQQTARASVSGTDATPGGTGKGIDLTFFVASDTHFGVEGIEDRNRAIVDQMNALPGTPYPWAVGGQVGVPAGVLITGDCTDSGSAQQWRQFVQYYGLTGKDGMLKYPVYETVGNHDGGGVVSSAVTRRHGDVYYSWDWQGVHMVCLGMYPNGGMLQWLREDLRKVGTSRPVVVYFHYALSGPYSGPGWWLPTAKKAFARSIRGYNVIGIFHGHNHGSGHYKWNGYDVYLVGSPKHFMHRFLAVRITADRMTVVARNFDNKRWDWQHSKAIRTPQSAGESRTVSLAR